MLRLYGRENFIDSCIAEWLARWSASCWPFGCSVGWQPIRFRIKSSRKQRKNSSKHIRWDGLKVKAKFLLVVSMRRGKRSVASAESSLVLLYI